MSSLAEKYPNLLDEWDTEQNSSLDPEKITSGSNLKVWWKCQCGTQWQAVVKKRTAGGSNCPSCKKSKVKTGESLEEKNPEIAKEWDYSKNINLSPKDFTASSHREVWWKCNQGHEWSQPIHKRTYTNQKCVSCSKNGHLENNSLLARCPELADEWNYDKNDDLTPDQVSFCTNDKVWWICAKNHEWRAIVNSRVRGRGCPYCSGHKATDQNNLALKHPEILEEWNYARNNIDPDSVTPQSHQSVWWICKFGHEWVMPVWCKVDDRSCPICSKSAKLRFEWLQKISEKEKIHILHQENSEPQIITVGEEEILVDGFCKKNKTVYFYYNCYLNGHPDRVCSNQKPTNPFSVNSRIGEYNFKLYVNLLEKESLLLEAGYRVESVWDCQYKKNRSNY